MHGILPAFQMSTQPNYERYLLSSNQMKLTIERSTADPYFVYYWVSSETAVGKILNDSASTGVPQISLGYLRDFPIPLPPLPEQRAIAAILSTWDEAITLTKALIETLQHRKQALMQLLLTGEVRFQEFEGSEWTQLDLEGICVLITDGTHFSPKSKGGPYKYITSKNIRYGKMDLADIDYISEEEHREIYKRCAVKFGDLLLTKDGANTGNAAINPLTEEFSLLSSVALIRADESKTGNQFLLQYLLSALGQTQIQDNIAGQAITRLTLEKIKGFRIPLPPLPEQSAIAEILSTCDESIAHTEGLVEGLQTQKRALMQQLLTGAIRVQGLE